MFSVIRSVAQPRSSGRLDPFASGDPVYNVSQITQARSTVRYLCLTRSLAQRRSSEGCVLCINAYLNAPASGERPPTFGDAALTGMGNHSFTHPSHRGRESQGWRWRNSLRLLQTQRLSLSDGCKGVFSLSQVWQLVETPGPPGQTGFYLSDPP
ncbi:hypothetical protein BOTBODRAFT_184111 [Botryobasidium botryosum FD-172 SS1]|uniref:Uncharacterized protein n=1 Tax=Botryobasidium botryosum (strain FD-172 SS1) TaxID=930990 RepID=A0A067MWZ4_BOTB1|nr:hypothetical protein BOTBODRAFT_184111 [Botryobasidium botryosum FD-172 SS1]